MRFPKFLVGMLGVLIAFAVTTYMMSNSLWTAVIETLICAVIIQIGYFGAVLFLVMRERSRNAERRKSLVSDEASSQTPSQPFNTSATKAP
ncbi:exopolysaccharide production repressor protein exox [Phyllobacterium salinisoli]|uniref:Exopolysaccharide production repressor protein exox n=1 Tax=Phyllobacterium salinisoli TaxID=1899321 RepID=A0A368KAY3_9HYPH|nr:exopolysaccharide production repressor protein [Phyllobacterium salinisoli]RCS25653.1 exopolysaccharide production repressor protein exox [Phyllobacterium salinisoli]